VRKSIHELLYPTHYELLPGPLSDHDGAASGGSHRVGPVTSVYMAALSRFGNSVKQTVNAVNLARYFNIGTVYLPSLPWMKAGVHHLGEDFRIVNVGNHVFDDERLILMGRFLTNPLFPTEWRRTTAWELFLENRGLLSFDADPPPLPDDHLVIHIRAGDIFAGYPAPGYGQPPLAFYLRILESRPWRQISVIAENEANPVIPALRDSIGDKGGVEFLTGRPLAEDLTELLRARTLVVSNGTFCRAVSALSGNLASVHEFAGTFHPWGNVRISREKWHDPDGSYTKSLLERNWRNSSDQLDLMLGYPAEKISLAGRTLLESTGGS